MENISKTFAGVRALHNVTFEAYRGEVLALVGENGAGKSTLMKILSGVYPYREYQGELTFEGRPLRFANTRAAQSTGISIIHQELNLIPELSVAENIFLGWEPAAYGWINWSKLYQQTRLLLESMQLDVDPRTPVGSLAIGQQQMVEIAKAISQDVRLLILDEPTSALTEHETEQLFKLISNLRRKGVTSIYISHKLEEVFTLADRITVLRDGQTVGTKAKSETNQREIVSMMVGRDIQDMFPWQARTPGTVILEVRGLSMPHPVLAHRQLLDDISFSVRAGEIVGISGLMGAGRSELAAALFGALRGKHTGMVLIGGQPVTIRSPAQAIRAGMSLLTEDRKLTGLIFSMSVAHNLSLAGLAQVCYGQWIDKGAENRMVAEYVQKIGIKIPGVQALVGTLSGGNQQKVVIAKWLATGPKVLILDEPTRGVDVGAKVEIYKLMNQLAAAGVAIVMISSELPEVLGMSDRILVMRMGKLVAHLDRNQATQETVMHYATGAAA